MHCCSLLADKRNSGSSTIRHLVDSSWFCLCLLFGNWLWHFYSPAFQNRSPPIYERHHWPWVRWDNLAETCSADPTRPDSPDKGRKQHDKNQHQLAWLRPEA